jgi:hypothetical protein
MEHVFELRNKLDATFDQESDRGCAILTVCLLESTISDLIGALLPDRFATAKQFMPRGRLSVGIANAYALGLIDDSLRDDLKALVEIRNIFAHRLLDGLSFESQSGPSRSAASGGGDEKKPRRRERRWPASNRSAVDAFTFRATLQPTRVSADFVKSERGQRRPPPCEGRRPTPVPNRSFRFEPSLG